MIILGEGHQGSRNCNGFHAALQVIRFFKAVEICRSVCYSWFISKTRRFTSTITVEITTLEKFVLEVLFFKTESQDLQSEFRKLNM